MAAAIKMDELLVAWLGNDTVYEDVCKLVESYRAATDPLAHKNQERDSEDDNTDDSPRGVIPPFYPKEKRSRRRLNNELPTTPFQTWIPGSQCDGIIESTSVRDQIQLIIEEVSPETKSFSVENFCRVTKEVFHFPSYFNGPLFDRIIHLWNSKQGNSASTISLSMLKWFWLNEMEPFDLSERFFRLLKQPACNYIARDDFLPYIKELLNDHPVSSICCRHLKK